MGAEIDRLELAVEAQASSANQQLDKLISRLDKVMSKLGNVNSGGLVELSNGIQHLSTAMKSLDGVKSTDFNKIVNGLNKLSTVNVQGVYDASRAINTLTANLSQIGMVTIDTQVITNLATAMSKLGSKTVTQAASNIPALTSALSGLISGMNGLQALTFDVTGLSNLITSVSKFGSKTAAQAIPNIQSLGTALSQFMTTMSNAPNVSQNVIQMTNALANLASQGSKVNTATRALLNVGNASSSASNNVNNFSSRVSALSVNAIKSDSILKKMVSTLKNFSAHITNSTNKSKSLSQIWGSFYASFFPIIRGLKALWKSVEKSMDYIETYNYYSVTLDKIGKEFANQYQEYGYKSADEYADSFKSRLNELTKKMTGYEVDGDGVLNLTDGKNLSIDPQQLMNYQASIAALTNSVGLVGENSVNTAKALSMLAADMSSFKNVDLSTVMTNFQSGLIGQSRALYKYGIDITNATLQTYAYKYGLETAVSEMTQADKMQLRLLAILDQSKVAWGDQANTINSVANQYRIMKQQASNVARAIGNLLTPVIQAALPAINGLLIALQKLTVFIGGLLGIDFSRIMDGISSGYGSEMDELADDIDSVTDGYDDADSAAKKLQRTILGFDQINKLNDDSDSSSSDSGDGGAGGIDLSNEIAAALAEYEAVWNEAFEKSVNEAQEYADKICAVFSNMWAMIKAGDYEGLGEYIAGAVDSVFEKIHSVFNWKTTGLWITEFVDGYCITINGIVDNVNWQNIGNAIGDGIDVITNSMYLYFTEMDWIGIGTAFAEGVNGIVYSVDWKSLGRTIGAWIMKIPKIVYGFVTTLDWAEVGIAIGNALNGVLMEFDGETIAGGINGIVNGIITALKNFIKTVDWGEVATAVGDVLGNLDWGSLAKVGLALAAVKLVSVFGGLLANVISENVKNHLKNGKTNLLTSIPAMLEPLSNMLASVLGGALKTISNALGGTSFGVTVGIFVAGVALLIAGIVDLWNTSETFRDNVSNMLNIIGGAFKEFKKQAWDEGLKPLWESIKELFGSLYEIYEASGLKTIFEAVVTGIGYIASFAIGGIIVVIGNFVKFLSNKIQMTVEILNTVLGFVNKFFREHEDTINGIKRIWGGLTEFLAGAFSGDWERAWNGIKEIFGGIWDTLVSIIKTPVNKVLSMLEGFANGCIKAFNTVKKALNTLNVDVPDWVPEIGGKSLGFHFSMTPTISLPRYEGGGFPNSGEMFIARENGITEMVGRMGNRAGVANNDQIVEGISSGVKEAIVDAVAEVAIAMNGGSGQSNSPVIEVTVKCDSETLYKTTQKGKQKADRRYQVVVPVG